MKIKRNYLIKLAPTVLLVGAAYWLLDSDFFTFLTWWEMICLLGLVFMPVTSRILWALMIMAGCFLKYWQSLYADMCSGCWPV